MTWAAVAVGVVLVTAGAVYSHDVKVKQNRAIGAMQEAYQNELDQITTDQNKDSKNLSAQLERDRKRRMENMRRVNPTGRSGIPNTPLQNMADENRGSNVTQMRGRGRLLGS